MLIATLTTTMPAAELLKNYDIAAQCVELSQDEMANIYGCGALNYFYGTVFKPEGHYNPTTSTNHDYSYGDIWHNLPGDDTCYMIYCYRSVTLCNSSTSFNDNGQFTITSYESSCAGQSKWIQADYQAKTDYLKSDPLWGTCNFDGYRNYWGYKQVHFSNSNPKHYRKYIYTQQTGGNF